MEEEVEKVEMIVLCHVRGSLKSRVWLYLE